MTKQQCNDRLAAITSEMDALITAAEGNGGVFTSEQDETYKTLKGESATVRERLAAHKRVDDARTEAAQIRGDLTVGGTTLEVKAPRGDGIGKIHDTRRDDPKCGFKSFGDFALRVMSAGPNPENDSALVSQIAAGTGMTSGVSQDGGVLVPKAFSTSIWDQARQSSDSLIARTTQVPIDSGVESITIPRINETSRANGSRWGGIQGYWKAQLTAMSESKPTMSEMTLQPQELYVFAYISDKLLRRAPGAASAILERAAADEINFKVGDSIFRGDGLGKPRGFLGHTATVSVDKETGQAAATINAKNINKMWSRCHANWRSGAVWYINQDVEPALEELSAVVGTGGVPIYLPPGGIADSPNARLRGRPVVVLEYCPTLGTVGDVVLANLSSYATAVRGMVDSSQSMHLKFDYAQTAFRFIFEVDGQPMLKDKITPYQGSGTLSPIVTLATRA